MTKKKKKINPDIDQVDLARSIDAARIIRDIILNEYEKKNSGKIRHWLADKSTTGKVDREELDGVLEHIWEWLEVLRKYQTKHQNIRFV